MIAPEDGVEAQMNRACSEPDITRDTREYTDLLLTLTSHGVFLNLWWKSGGLFGVSVSIDLPGSSAS